MPFANKSNISDGEKTTLNDQYSALSPASFSLVIDALKFKNVEYNVQTVSLPEISTGEAITEHAFSSLGVRPDKLRFSNLDITFLIDEDMVNYKEIYDWLHYCVTAEDNENTMRDMSLVIIDSKNNATKNVKFVNAHPISLSGIPFDATVSDRSPMAANVSFRIDYYIVE